jgi:thiaminase (transcriptional activator TenA)
MISDVLHIMSETGRSRISGELHERGRPVWASAISHPMVKQIGEGTLPHPTFRRYFEQNILYLNDYARSIGFIIGKAPDWDAADVLSRFLRQIVGAEIPANIAFLSRLGGSPDATSGTDAMTPTTYAYTRHLLSACAQGRCEEGLAAVLPCQWSYGELARPLMDSPPADEVYADWIAMFGNDQYASLVNETTGLLDRLADSADAVSVGRLSSIFDRSVSYEVEFWDMAYGAHAAGGTAGGMPAGREPGQLCVQPGFSRT